MRRVADPEASVPVDGDVTPGVGFRYAAGFAAAVTLSLIVSFVALDRAGVAARSAPASTPPLVVADSAKALLAAWDRAGLHGVVLVDVTRDTAFGLPPIAPGSTHDLSGWPVPLPDNQALFREGVDRHSLVWVAAHTGIARSVTYVMTPADFAAKVRVGRQRGLTGIAPGGRSVTANDDGYTRFLSVHFPTTPAAASVLNIDASYFVNGRPDDLMRQLDLSSASYRFVTLDRATDATDVPQAARQRLDRMAELLRERGLK
jgi:hypothetical protein